MRKIITAILLTFIVGITYGQTKVSKMSFVSFYSELEDVMAENYSGVSELNTQTGRLIFSFAIQSFTFENAVMQKHFNEKDVMNSKEFPKAKFVGTITNNADVNYSKDGEYTVNVTGNMTMKGTSNPITTKAIIKIVNGKIYTSATFKLDRFLYGVNGKEDSISQILDITVKAQYE